jgi:hypothetical protein
MYYHSQQSFCILIGQKGGITQQKEEFVIFFAISCITKDLSKLFEKIQEEGICLNLFYEASI